MAFVSSIWYSLRAGNLIEYFVLFVLRVCVLQGQREWQHPGQSSQSDGIVRQQFGTARRGEDGRLFGGETTLRGATLPAIAQVIDS